MLRVALFLNRVFFRLELIQRAPFIFHGDIVQLYMSEAILLDTVASMASPKKGADPIPWGRQRDLTASPTARASICISYPTSPRPSHTLPLQVDKHQPGGQSMHFLGGESPLGAHQ